MASEEITIKVPHRISGFFQIVEGESGRPFEDISRVGSRGGGPALTAFGTTRVRVKPTEHNSTENRPDLVRVVINGKDDTAAAKTSQYVASQLLPRNQEPVNVEIFHTFDLPIGCGYGASGAGALGAAIGLVMLLDLPYSMNEAGRIAHVAEVMNKTGLGTVGGQLCGGFSITTRAGFPFTMDKLLHDPALRVVCGTFGKIPTSDILKNWDFKNRITKYGKKALALLMERPTVRKFMDVSWEFVEAVGFGDVSELQLEDTMSLIHELNQMEVHGASMNQLGRSVFCCCEAAREEAVLEVFESYQPSIQIFPLSVCDTGPQVTARREV